jgi:hypothetical protein
MVALGPVDSIALPIVVMQPLLVTASLVVVDVMHD